MRADGTSWGPEIAQPAPPAEAAISFRHYMHKPNKAARGHFEKALKATQAKRDGEALDRLTDAVRLDPEFFEAHLQMGVVWLQAESPERALPYLERALSIDSSSQAAQALAAWALLRLGRVADAEFAFKRSLQMGRSIPLLEEMLEFTRAHRNDSPQATP